MQAQGSAAGGLASMPAGWGTGRVHKPLIDYALCAPRRDARQDVVRALSMLRRGAGVKGTYNGAGAGRGSRFHPRMALREPRRPSSALSS